MLHSVQGQYINLSNTKLYYHQIGEGPVILFIHGHRSDALRFKGFLITLSELGHVLAPDLPGCGKSPPYRNHWHSLKAYAQTLEEFVEKLDLKEITLVGGSMGGVIALLLFPKIAPRVKKLVLLVTPVDASLFKSKYQRYRRLTRIFPLLVKTGVVPRLIDQIIKNDRLMNYLLRKNFAPKDRKPEIIQYEKTQWRAMSFSIWMQTNYSLANIHLSELPSTVTIPTLIVETKSNQYYDSPKNVELLKSIAPNHRVVLVPWETHVPKGEIPREFFDPYKNEFVEFLKD